MTDVRRVAPEPGSWRDPAGFVFRRDGTLHRQINASFGPRWEALTASGLLEDLQRRQLLVDHVAEPLSAAADPSTAHAVIRPVEVAFVSYPYEWSFGQLRDAALLTLELESLANERGFTLRDASAFNVQFERGRPLFIDTLSFEPLAEGEPWRPYRQFCEHFLAPLALMAHRDASFGLQLRNFLDGTPLALAAALLPGRTRLSTGLGAHLHLHARAQRRHAASADGAAPSTRLSPLKRKALLDSLRRTVEGLRWEPSGTEWSEYTTLTSYDQEGAGAKARSTRDLLDAAGGRVVWDIGANVGVFSAIAAELGREVVALDVDPAATERHYRRVRGSDSSILPLVQDLMNPSPRLGWGLAERRSLEDRANADTVLALALVHHLAIARNVPLPMIAAMFARLASGLVIEFVPKEDPMVRRLLASRDDIFPTYTVEGFRSAFAGAYDIVDERPIEGSLRTLYRMVRRA